MVILSPWLGLLIVGLILLVVAYNVAMGPPLNQLARVIGWVLVALAALLLVLDVLGATGLFVGPGGGLILLGLVLLVIGYAAPLPLPAPRVCRLFGWLCVCLGLLLLVIDLVGAGGGRGVRIGMGLTQLAGGLLLVGMAMNPEPSPTLPVTEPPIPAPAPIPAPVPIPAPAIDPAPPPVGDTTHYLPKWAASIICLLLAAIAFLAQALRMFAPAALPFSEQWYNAFLLAGTVAGMLGAALFPGVVQWPTPVRMLAERAARGEEIAAVRLQNLARTQWRTKQ